ncbi:hypothetical protein [Bradyrhizobium phage BDU-MI-1]|nr:hypothetical protein [Bradyrhizobium phage BDU-MI-1]
MTGTLTSEVTTITVMAQTILQLALLSGGAILCVLTAVAVFHLLGWGKDDEADHG